MVIQNTRISFAQEQQKKFNGRVVLDFKDGEIVKAERQEQPATKKTAEVK